MKSAREIPAEDVINENPITAKTGESLSSIKNRMEENEIRAIPVIDEEENFKGAIGYRDLVRFIQFNPQTTKLSKVMHQPPKFEMDLNLVELADLRINSGRKMLVALEGNKLAGIIGGKEFLQVFQNVEELENINTRDICSYELEFAYEDDPIDKTRHQMLDNNISRLPVIDSDGNLTGIVDSLDILKMMVPREKQRSGGTSGGRSGRKEINIAGGDEKIDLAEVTANELMSRVPCFSEQHLSGKKAIEKMIQEESDEIIFTDDKYPEEIITLKDFIDYLTEFSSQETLLVQLTGVDLPEEKAVIHQKIKNQVQGSLGRKLNRPQEMTLRVKKSEKGGKKHRWELDLKLVSEYGVTTVNEEGWELMDTLDEALNELNRIIRDKHEKASEHRN